MPRRKQKKNNRKLADVVKEFRKTRLCHEIENSPAQTEKPLSGMQLQNNENYSNAPKAEFKVKVPPIFLHQPVDFKEHVYKLLLSGVKFYQPHKGTVYTIIKCLTFEDHKNLTQYLKSNKLPYHTYGNPNHRKQKVIIRGLSNDTSLNVLKDELESIKIPVVRLHKMHTKQSEKEHPLLVLVVVPNYDESKKLKQVETLLGTKVKMEAPIAKARQCHRCQKWGHSQRYCHGQVRCVKCAGTHFTSKCTREPISAPPKCANCGGVHTANYKKCSHCPESDEYKLTLKLKLKKNEQNIKATLVTLLNYESELYNNLQSLGQLEECQCDTEFDNCRKVD